MAQRPLPKRVGYRSAQVLARLTGVLAFNVRCSGRERFPREGGVLVCSNHQSYLDPVLVGLACDRPLNYLARKSLFRNPAFRWLIEFFDAIPIDREGLGASGFKETLRRLRRGEPVLIFPEGTRTRDGEVSPLKHGFCTLARRTGVPIAPVGLDGAFDAWSRYARAPRRAPIHIVLGEPISPEEAQSVSEECLCEELERRIRACHAQARAERLHLIEEAPRSMAVSAFQRMV